MEIDSSPLATVEEIQRRLVRPSSDLHSHSSTFSVVPSLDDRDHKLGTSSQIFVKPKNRDELVAKNKKLDDYLDPVLLSVISGKINSKKWKQDLQMNGDSIKRKEFCDEFEWPLHKLKEFKEDSNSRSVKRRRRSETVVDLNNDDLDPIGDDDAINEQEMLCGGTPFRKFEIMASKQFKRGEG